MVIKSQEPGTQTPQHTDPDETQCARHDNDEAAVNRACDYL